MSVDLSAAIKLDIGNENTALSYAHSFSLQSPTYPAPHSETCLTLEYTSLVELAVKIACQSVDKADEKVLRRSSTNLGYYLHRMSLVIPGRGEEYESCLLVFDISTRKSGYLAAMSSVTLTDGTCVYPGMFLFAIRPLSGTNSFVK